MRCRNYRGQWTRHGRQALVYGYGGLSASSWPWVAETYRRRFAIETTYRQLHPGRIRTCTRGPLRRLLEVGIALRLRNVWGWLHGEVWSPPRRGGRRTDPHQLAFRKMLVGLQHLAEALAGVGDDIRSKHPIAR